MTILPYTCRLLWTYVYPGLPLRLHTRVAVYYLCSDHVCPFALPTFTLLTPHLVAYFTLHHGTVDPPLFVTCPPVFPLPPRVYCWTTPFRNLRLHIHTPTTYITAYPVTTTLPRTYGSSLFYDTFGARLRCDANHDDRCVTYDSPAPSFHLHMRLCPPVCPLNLIPHLNVSRRPHLRICSTWIYSLTLFYVAVTDTHAFAALSHCWLLRCWTVGLTVTPHVPYPVTFVVYCTLTVVGFVYSFVPRLIPRFPTLRLPHDLLHICPGCYGGTRFPTYLVITVITTRFAAAPFTTQFRVYGCPTPGWFRLLDYDYAHLP